ncbi:MAG: hypothetical protein EOO52_06380 [Gammaproteobacteria bacterium]|nr:MAG: hypothetical protein EOO52_06380 [Gammaproteobacteria bacterium]
MLKNILAAMMVLTCPLVFAAESVEVKALKKDMPQDVVLMIDRIIECNHWNGEESTNKERIKQIESVRTKLGCDALPDDQAALRKRHQNNYEVKSRLNNAEQIFY